MPRAIANKSLTSKEQLVRSGRVKVATALISNMGQVANQSRFGAFAAPTAARLDEGPLPRKVGRVHIRVCRGHIGLNRGHIGVGKGHIGVDRGHIRVGRGRRSSRGYDVHMPVSFHYHPTIVASTLGLDAQNSIHLQYVTKTVAIQIFSQSTTKNTAVLYGIPAVKISSIDWNEFIKAFFITRLTLMIIVASFSHVCKHRKEDFQNNLDNLFDIAHADALERMKIKNDQIFLQKQREPEGPGSLAGVEKELIENEERIRQRKLKEEKERHEHMCYGSLSSSITTDFIQAQGHDDQPISFEKCFEEPLPSTSETGKRACKPSESRWSPPPTDTRDSGGVSVCFQLHGWE
ncbi:hypothetical protein EVAR_12594_1 [Eumeta japonica]|uniref:Uncharacterized protein n=1 Tax=Eumeta variegata TaxID=151549 RepID=A0A4C1UFN4_EUMVA|nr:hypothetical protein EVAR_12594_1 [Eumeta japonica]